MNTQSKELKERVEAKRKRMEAQLHELKADTSQSARQHREALERKLEEVRRDVADGYDNMKHATVEKLNAWLRD